MPEALTRFVYGLETSAEESERVLRLQGELQRLLYADHAETEGIVTPQIRMAIHSAWIERLQTYIPVSGTTFFDDMTKAQRRMHIKEPKTPKQCLAEAYMVLAKPVTVFAFGSQEDEFLLRHGGQIDTWTVRKYAEILWRNSRRPKHGESIISQLKINLDIGGALPEIRWSQLFQELGLTKEFLPRGRGGRPSNEAKKANFRRPKKLRIRSQSVRKPQQKTSD
jgi:hypothetical protein